ncbi:MAG: hypothetical protein JXA90_12120 [Planctomycetes bacterium]|nr:hypothetical protein [Planctomycetota bacterium]
MPLPRTLLPLEALHTAVHHRPAPVVEVTPLDEARGRYLASPLELPRGGRAAIALGLASRVLCDGYALAEEARPGEELEVVGEIGATSPWPGIELAEGRCARVECGARVPALVQCVLPVSCALLVGEGRIRCEDAVPAGAGLLRLQDLPAAESLEAGERLSPRLLAQLAGLGVEELQTVRPPRVGVLSVGDELTAAPADASRREERDLTGIWLADALVAEGMDPAALGIVPDDPAEIRRVFLRARRRRLDVLILAGGLGDGISDRTAEAIRTLDSRILFERIHLRGCSSFLFAKASGIDVFALSGLPLAASAGHDLFLQPALRARCGARRGLWDWSRGRCAPRARESAEASPPPPLPPEPPWRLLAARRIAGGEGGAAVSIDGLALAVWEPGDPFCPRTPGADGWAVAAGGPAAVGEPLFYLPLDPSLR